ncbi:hypothetical protein GCM10012280_18330 [Wenjunlia tyrosinilytica]|uniref:Uncharacterized protein n=1 Tax=Wenjunlia tyrosinilytica TaxID=1544741 RepID=A0A917ZMS1_9ACTN|nr:hypothetical protein GCM10012280_18330 [Wenjunlia tyrosinilytica]
MLGGLVLLWVGLGVDGLGVVGVGFGLGLTGPFVGVTDAVGFLVGLCFGFLCFFAFFGCADGLRDADRAAKVSVVGAEPPFGAALDSATVDEPWPPPVPPIATPAPTSAPTATEAAPSASGQRRRAL